jgi:hypothetical protein
MFLCRGILTALVFDPKAQTPEPRTRTSESFSQSGNKLPTIVQKFYLMKGKKIHELANKFF